jgi:phosphate transport system substrate-binding protein
MGRVSTRLVGGPTADTLGGLTLHRHLLAAPMLIGVLAMASCGGNDSGTAANSSSSSSSTSASSSKVNTYTCATGTATASGSTALLPLAQKAATDYAAKCPGGTINVSGGGSSTGLANVAAGTSDIGDSDVPVTDAPSIDASSVTDHQVAIVAFAIIVNPKTAVTNLTLKQAQDVFSGKVTNWKDVGGANLPVTLIERKPGSGTRLSFDKCVMRGTAESTTPSSTQDSTQLVVQGVEGADGGASYVGLASVGTTTAVNLDGVKPDGSTVKAGTYPFWSHEHMYTKGAGSALAQSFIGYILSDEFQAGPLTTLGFLPLSTTTTQSLADK